MKTIFRIFQEDSSLVTIGSEAENRFILRLVQDTSPTTSEIWLGTFRGKQGSNMCANSFANFWSVKFLSQKYHYQRSQMDRQALLELFWVNWTDLSDVSEYLFS